MRTAVTKGLAATYTKGGSEVPHFAFNELPGNRLVNNLLTRVFFGFFGSLHFVFVLPVQLVWNRRTVAWVEVKQWLCFVPSVLLSVSLYAVVVALLLVAENAVETLFVLVAAQVLARFNGEYITRTFHRNRAGALLLVPFSSTSSSTAGYDFAVQKLVKMLHFECEVVVNGTDPVFENRTLLDVISLTTQVINAYRGYRVIVDDGEKILARRPLKEFRSFLFLFTGFEGVLTVTNQDLSDFIAAIGDGGRVENDNAITLRFDSSILQANPNIGELLGGYDYIQLGNVELEEEQPVI